KRECEGCAVSDNAKTPARPALPARPPPPAPPPPPAQTLLAFSAMRSLAAAFVLVALASAQPAPADAVRQRLIGNWKLVKIEVFAPNGDTRPGTYDVGRLMYDARGEMSAHLMRS